MPSVAKRLAYTANAKTVIICTGGSNAKASNSAVTKKKSDGNSSKNAKNASSANDDDSDDRSSPPKLNPRLSMQRQTEVRAAMLFGEYTSNTSDNIPAPQAHYSLQMPETYKPSGDVDAWLRRMKQYCRASHITDPVRIANIIAGRLSDPVHTNLTNLLLKEEIWDDPNALCGILLRQYGDKKTVSQHRTDFRHDDAK